MQLMSMTTYLEHIIYTLTINIETFADPHLPGSMEIMSIGKTWTGYKNLLEERLVWTIGSGKPCGFSQPVSFRFLSKGLFNNWKKLMQKDFLIWQIGQKPDRTKLVLGGFNFLSEDHKFASPFSPRLKKCPWCKVNLSQTHTKSLKLMSGLLLYLACNFNTIQNTCQSARFLLTYNICHMPLPVAETVMRCWICSHIFQGNKGLYLPLPKLNR